MADVTSLDDWRPHITVPTLDGNVHVLPLSLLYRYVNGEIPLTDIDQGDEIVRAMLSHYLSLFEADHE